MEKYREELFENYLKKLIGLKIRHGFYGEGIITAVKGIKVALDSEKGVVNLEIEDNIFKFAQPLPESKEVFDEVKAAVEAYNKKLAEEAKEALKKAAEERAKTQKEEAARKKNTITRNMKSNKNNNERFVDDNAKKHGRRGIFFCFQDTKDEIDSGHLWAPLITETGRRISSWDSLMDLREKDIILQCIKGQVVALSTVIKESYFADKPSYLCTKKNWALKGRMVDIDTKELANPVDTKTLIGINKLSSVNPLSPFNKNGTGNQGYLFYMSPDLADAYLDQIERNN